MRGDDRLRGHRHLVNRALCEVHEFLGMAGDEIGVAAHVTGVRSGGGVSGFHRRRHRRIWNRSP
jgi:hypothetical protein